MKVVVIDGQSGRMGQVLIERIKAAALPCGVVAIGTNAIATSAMLKAGADAGATGENPVVSMSKTTKSSPSVPPLSPVTISFRSSTR